MILAPIELKGFAPIGILEYWNDGIMGFTRQISGGLKEFLVI